MRAAAWSGDLYQVECGTDGGGPVWVVVLAIDFTSTSVAPPKDAAPILVVFDEPRRCSISNCCVPAGSDEQQRGPVSSANVRRDLRRGTDSAAARRR